MKSLRKELGYQIFQITARQKRTAPYLDINRMVNSLRDIHTTFHYYGSKWTPRGQMFTLVPNNFLLQAVNKR
jgi:hypothetical protein